MNKKRVRWINLVILPLVAILIASSSRLPARADGGSPADMLQRAWRSAQDTGSYRFISDLNQTLIPRPIPEMIGQQETALNLAFDGAVVLPDQAYMDLRVTSGNRSGSVALLRDGGQSFMLQDGALKPVEEALNLASQSNDVLGYLAAAEQVTLLDPPEGHPELARYGFVVSGPRYAEYVRQQAEAAMRAEPGAPEGLTLKPLPVLQTLSGQGELWVNQAGLPVRQVVDLEMPEATEEYRAFIRLTVDLSAYGKVEALPRAVRGADGTWHLEGALTAGTGPNLGAFPGFEAQPDQPAQAAVGWRAWLSFFLPRPAWWRPVRIAPTDVALFFLTVLVLLIVRYYRRNWRRCYTLIVLILISSMVLTPLLQAGGVVRFVERQVQAAEARAASMPDLLHALGFDAKAIKAASATQADDSRSDATTAQLELNSQFTARGLANVAASGSPLQQGDGESQPSRCGQGEPGVDTDADGLTDQVELCLGTSYINPDTDSDAITDTLEIQGFDLGGTHWDSDPMKPDSNGDGLLDTFEWATSLVPTGMAADPDMDGDGIPNLWDDDDDNDGVPDRLDLSAFSVTGATSLATLSTEATPSDGYEFIEIEVRPANPAHLRYSTTALDWPYDEEGNVQDLDDSTDDLRLVPFLLVTTNATPVAGWASKYGYKAWESDGEITLLVPMALVEDGGGAYAFYGKVAYAPDKSGDIQWEARLIWMAQMQADRWSDDEVATSGKLLHEYEDPFVITGLKVTKDAGYEAAVLGTPTKNDDVELFRVLAGMRQVYKENYRLEGQGDNETALQEIAGRFASNSTMPIDATFNVAPASVEMLGPNTYLSQDAGIAGIGTDLIPTYLDTYSADYQGDCQDAEGNLINCASLVIAYQQATGSTGLDELPRVDGDMVTADLDSLHVNLAGVTLLPTRGVQMRMYEQDASGAWQMVTAARMLEFVEQRYKDSYSTDLRDLYPGLSDEDVRLIAYTGYLWATAPSYTVIAADGQILVPELADEVQLALDRALPEGTEDDVVDVIDYVGLGTDLAWALETGAYIRWAAGDFDLEASPGSWKGIGQTLFLATSITSTAMAIANAVCDNTSACMNEELLSGFNLGIDYLSIVAQTQYVLDLAKILFSEGKLAFEGIAKNVQVVGMVIGIYTTWIYFGLTVGSSGGDPIVWRMALVEAVMTTAVYIIAFVLNFIPLIGPLVSAIFILIDQALGFILSLLGLDDFAGIAAILIGLFYSADVVTSLQDAHFGAFESGLTDPDMGLIDGNTFILSAPAYGIVQKEDGARDSDLEASWVEGVLQTEPLSNTFGAQETNTALDCQIVADGDEKHCSNTPAVRFALTPQINGTGSFVAKFFYATVWAEYMFWGTVRVNSHVTQGQIPPPNLNPFNFEEDEDLTQIFLDVLPATLDELWGWSELTNPDGDGDGLMDNRELALGSDPTTWDSDGDGLSDQYEFEIVSADGSDLLNPDSDGDGLSDGLERILGTEIGVADSDGDGLSDGQEVRRYQGGAMVGGWQVKLPGGPQAWIYSDPLKPDADGDGLNDSEEQANGTSPFAANAVVPRLSMSVGPIRGLPGGRVGAYWLPGEAVTATIDLENWGNTPVTTSLTLYLPNWLDTIGGGAMQGDRSPAMQAMGNTLTWSFARPEDTLQLYESISVTVTARVKSTTTSVTGAVALGLTYNDVQLQKTISAVVDGKDPNVAIVAPTDGTYLRGTGYVVGGSATDSTTWIASRSLSIVPQGSNPSFQALPLGWGPWAYTWVWGSDGVYSLQARATDAMGHTATTAPVIVTVDNVPPQATVGWVMGAGVAHLSGTATDDRSGVERTQISIDGQPWRSVTLSGPDWAYDWPVSAHAQGKHTVRARAIDRCGNQSTIASTTIIVDSVPPSSIVNSGADLAIPPAVQANTPFALTGVADEGGHLPLPAAPADLTTGMDVFNDSAIWLGRSTIHDNDGGVLATWIGDLNADRLSDLAVGLPGPEGDGGSVTVLYGRAGGWPVAPDLEMLANSPMRFTGAAGARLGSMLAAAGDPNGDHISDLLIGERDSTRAFLIFGTPRPFGEVTLDAGQPGIRVMLQAPATITGLASAGDVNADNLDDLLVVAGGKAYLVLAHPSPWFETLDVAAEAAATFDGVTRALGVGDVDNDQAAEWVTLANGSLALYGWNSGTAAAEVAATFTTADADPRAAALGDVDGDGTADWLYADGSSRILVYGSGPASHTFTNYDGFFVAPGDVDGDGRPDILLGDATGVASLIHQPAGGTPTVLATIQGVGGAANAPYAAGADLNSDGSADLLLIPSQAAAEERGFDAPDFSSGFISPQSLPLGAATMSAASVPAPRMSTLSMLGVGLLSATGPDTRYVDDDSVCDGNTPCYTSIQAAVTASDGGGDTVIVYPGVYDSFSVPADTKYNNLTVQGVSADAVFVDGAASTQAIRVGADGVRLSNLTVRNATAGVALDDGAGVPLAAGGPETAIDHLVAHTVQNPIAMSEGAALSLTHSTLVGDGVHPIIATTEQVDYLWAADQAIAQSLSTNGALAGTDTTLYAIPGGTNRSVYAATPGAGGALGTWSEAFQLLDALPPTAGTSNVAAGGNYLVESQPTFQTPDYGTSNGVISATAAALNGDIYVGGSFTQIGGITAYNVARWDGSAWHPLGASATNGVDGPVYALTVTPNGDVYVGGAFATAYNSGSSSTPATWIARWDGTFWHHLGDAPWPGGVWGLNGPVYALAHTDDGVVLVGGSFTQCFQSYESKWCVNFAAYMGSSSYNPDPLHPWFFDNGMRPGGPVRSIVWQGGNYWGFGGVDEGWAYVAGDFDTWWYDEVVNNVVRWQNDLVFSGGTQYYVSHLQPLASGIALASGLSDVAYDARTGNVYAVSQDPLAQGVYWFDGYCTNYACSGSWSNPTGVSGLGAAVAVDSDGDAIAAMSDGSLVVKPAGQASFESLGSEASPVRDLLADNAGQVVAVRGDATSGGVRRWANAGLARRNLVLGTWDALPYPPGVSRTAALPVAVDDAGTLYAIGRDSELTTCPGGEASDCRNIPLYRLDPPLGIDGSGVMLDEDFEGDFPPAGWTIVNHRADTDCVWNRNDQWYDMPNITGGGGYSAAAYPNIYICGPWMDAELRTPAMNLSYATTANLNFVAAYQQSLGDFHVNVSTDNGATWTLAHAWYISAEPTTVSIDLTPYVGHSQVVISFTYNGSTTGWAQVDQVKVTTSGFPSWELVDDSLFEIPPDISWGAPAKLVWAGFRLFAAFEDNGTWRAAIADLRPEYAGNIWSTFSDIEVYLDWLFPHDAPIDKISLTADDMTHVYILSNGGNLTRERHAFNFRPTPWPKAFDFSLPQSMASVGNYLYVYTADPAATSNIQRFGEVGLEQRVQASGNAFVLPDSASNANWAVPTSYHFEMAVSADNAWVGPSGAAWNPRLPSGETALTSAQADFMAPANGLYRLGANSLLDAGYHTYLAAAHVYASEAACTGCAYGSPVWGETAFATLRAAVESGAARVLVHPGRYPQSFYLVSGVEVIGSGAELTIIEAPAGSPATLVTAEGVAGASLARVTLAGGPLWDGFMAEGGATGLKLTRCIIRDLDTGVRLSGGSEVEIVNNTFVRNADGILVESTTPVDVRNTILAYNTGTGLQYGASPASLSNTYNDFWANGTDMARTGGQPDPSPGSLFLDPRFRSLAEDDLRLSDDSPLIDAGAPNDPTVPGAGERVDIGYAEYNAAGFYVSHDYSETGLNDGLTWGIDAFAAIQHALDAAAAALHDLQGAVPEGGYSVAVDVGTYYEFVSVPSHVRLVGSGPELTTIEGSSGGCAVAFRGVIDSELTGFTVGNGAYCGVWVGGAASGITLERNVITHNHFHAISLSESASAAVRFNTIVDNNGAGVYATGAGTWVDVRENILSRNATGLQAASGAVVRNSYNLLYNTTDVSGVVPGDGTLTGDPAFADAGTYVPSADSPALDAAEPWAEVPVGGGTRADLGYKELIASPLTVVLGPEIASTVVGNAGVAQVEVAVVAVSDPAQPPSATLPTTWDTLTPAKTDAPLFAWSHSLSLATPGLYRVYSRATDAAGNVETDESDWYEGAFVVDDTAPAVTWITTPPANTDAAGVLAQVAVAGTVSTGTGTRDDVAQVFFNVTGPDGTKTFPAEGGRAWIPLPNTGSYTVDAVAVDEAGNTAQQSTTVAVTASSSVATVTNLPDGSAVSGTSITLRGNVRFTGAGAGSVAVTAGSTTVQATLDAPGAIFSAWSAGITLPAGEGAKSVTVTPGLDGTDGTATTLSLTLDATAPTLALTTPAAGTTVTRTATFSGTVSDTGSGVAGVEVSVDGGYTWRPAALAGGAWSLDWDLGPDLDYASYPAQVRALDAAGNIALVERTVAADGVPPTDLAPVSFSEPAGQHVDRGTDLTITWSTPVDGSGTAQVYLAVDQDAETVPTALASDNSAAATLDTYGEWYVHRMTQDAAGNQALTHYGPWYVRDLTAEVLGDRRQSIVVDGYLDLAHDEWRAPDLLGRDARSGNPQELYASWDGQAIYLGWSKAWWTLDGVLWAYLDTTVGGTNTRMDGVALPDGLAADLAVEITAPDDGVLWAWNGSAWEAASLDFANGPSGDTEVQIPWTPSSADSLDMIAYALPRAAEVGQGVQMQVLASGEMLDVAGAGIMAEKPASAPWAVFPTTNALDPAITHSFAWSPEALADPTQVNADQPTARTVVMAVTSPQPAAAPLCPGSDIVYDILLTNPEPEDISGLMLVLMATNGLTYQAVSGASLASGNPGDANWTLSVAYLAPGATAHVQVTARPNTGVTGLQPVGSTITLSAGATLLTPESNAETTAVHLVDGQAPTVTIDVPSGSAVTAGSAIFTGLASDGRGCGVGYVKVSTDGNNWYTAAGTQAWTYKMPVPEYTTEITLQAYAVDKCGRFGAEASQTFIVDATPPEVAWTLPPVITAAPARIAGTTHDPAPSGGLVAQVEVQVDSETAPWRTAAGPYAPVNGTQAWAWSWPTPQDDNVVHNLRVRATDMVGNLAVTGWQTTTVDVIAPQIAVTLQETSLVLPDDPPDGETSPVQVPGGGVDDGRPFRIFVPLVRKEGTAQPGRVNALLRTRTSNQASLPAAGPVFGGTVTDGAGMQAVHVLAAGPVLGGTVTDGAGVQAVRILVYDPLGNASTMEATLADGNWEYTPDLAGWVVGTYALRVQAVDVHGNVRMQGPYLLQVQDAPIAGLTVTNDGPRLIGQVVTLEASVSAGSNVIYTWDLGDGTTGEGRVVQHAYTEAGEYTAGVTAGNSASSMEAETLVTIRALRVEAGEDQAAAEGDTVSIAATFTDGREDVLHSASIDWGDGTTPTAGTVDEAGFAISGSHAYADNGEYTVTVTVDDGAGHTASDTLQVTVGNVAPTATLSNDGPQDEASSVTVSFTEVHDPGTADSLAYSFDWDNDGTYEIVDQDAASAEYTWPDDGTYTVKGMVKDDDGGSNEYTTEVTVNNVAPTVDAGADATIDEGATFSSSGSFTDPGADTWSATVDYGDGSGVVPLTLTDKAFDLSRTYADNGVYQVEVCVTDDDTGSGCDTTQVTVNNVAPVVGASPESQTVQYSEAIAEITFTATDVAADEMTAALSWSADGTTFQTDPAFAGLVLDGGSCGANGGINTCIWKGTGNVGMPAGTYTLRLTVTDKDGGTTDKDVTLIVQPEEATVTFDDGNPVAERVASAGGASGPFDLGVCVSERDTPPAGDINLAQVSMSLVPVGPGSPVAGTAGTPTVENGHKCVTFSFTGVPVNTYTAQVTVDGGYYAGAGEDVLVVYDPSLGFTTGGGWFYWPHTADEETGYPGDKTNFGYTMKYNKKGGNVQGSLLLIRHLADGTIYRVKSNALYGLALGEDATVPMGWASFSGKSTYQEPGWLDPIGNYEFLVYVEDRNEPGTGVDRLWIEVTGGLALPREAQDNAVELGGGNLVVPHSAR